MRKKIIFILFLHASISSFSQAVPKDGYILKGDDTIWCKILYDSEHPFFWNKVTPVIGGVGIEYAAGGAVTGFAIVDGEINIHYGAVLTKTGYSSKILFVQKRVTGTVELYEHHYNIYKTRRTTDGSKGTTTSESYTDYYIARNHNAGLSTPSFLPSFKKKHIFSYTVDNPNLWKKEEKKITLPELIALLKEFNDWYSQKHL